MSRMYYSVPQRDTPREAPPHPLRRRAAPTAPAAGPVAAARSGQEPRSGILRAHDGYPLGATVFPAEGAVVAVINGATAVPQRYYRPFAEYLASHGIAAVTFDYRGIGASRPARGVRSVTGGMLHWGTQDASAVLDWTLKRFPGREIVVVGHSFGGQCLGLLRSSHHIRRVLLVAAQLGYWGHFAGRHRLFAWFAMRFTIPWATRFLGYFPGKRLGVGEDLPANVALEWSRWCLSPNHLFDFISRDQREAYRRVTAPLLAYKFPDDPYASGDSVDRLLPFYPEATSTLCTVAPGDVGMQPIGHFRMFRSQFQEALWAEWKDWLLDGRLPRRAGGNAPMPRGKARSVRRTAAPVSG